MGDEAQKEQVRDGPSARRPDWHSGADACPPPQRLRDFAGFQITEDLLRRGGAKANARFMHCLPRKP
jgi:ornithine carbamoyltransferase